MAVFGANAFRRRVAFSENASQAAQENSVDTAGKQAHQIGPPGQAVIAADGVALAVFIAVSE